MLAGERMAATEQNSDSNWPSAARGWLVVFLLALASMASQFDRTVVGLSVQPLKQHFELNDTQFGLLQSVAFGLFYTLACFPIGRMADLYARRSLIGVCLALFSLCSMASGLARNYLQLFLTRVGVGFGEAAVTPAGLSMLSDHFPADRLGKPVGAFLMSAPIGQGLAFMGGGYLLQWLAGSTFLQGGLLSNLEPWQATFIIIGFPGLLLAPVFLLLKEPVRRGSKSEAPLRLDEVIAIVKSRRVALVPMFCGFSMVTLVSYTISLWAPALFQRSYGWNPAQIGLGFGLVVMTFGTAGAYFGGWMSDRMMQRGMLDAPLRVAAYGFVGCGIFGVLAPLMPSAPLALLMLMPAMFFSNTPYACAGSSLQLIVPNRARGQVSALYIIVLTLVGLVVGPLIVALITDYVFKDPADIRYSLAIVIGCAVPLMFVVLRTAFAPYRELRSRAH